MAKELFGQFLIRQDKVRQDDIEEALVLQEILHDSLGAAALANDLVTFKQVGQILELMDNSESNFIEAAIELKILTPEQIEDLKVKAGDCQFRLGQLLVATTKLTQKELDEELAHFATKRLLVPSTNVTKAELIGRISSRTGTKSATVKKVLESILENVSKELNRGRSVVLKGFGTFRVTEYAARGGRNPRTGEPIEISQRKVAQLRFSRGIRRKVDERSR
jgi:DNA-binding protein HU-beta